MHTKTFWGVPHLEIYLFEKYIWIYGVILFLQDPGYRSGLCCVLYFTLSFIWGPKVITTVIEVEYLGCCLAWGGWGAQFLPPSIRVCIVTYSRSLELPEQAWTDSRKVEEYVDTPCLGGGNGGHVWGPLTFNPHLHCYLIVPGLYGDTTLEQARTDSVVGAVEEYLPVMWEDTMTFTRTENDYVIKLKVIALLSPM